MTIKKYTQRVGKLYLLPLPPYESFYWAPMGQPPCPIHTRLDLIHLRVLQDRKDIVFGFGESVNSDDMKERKQEMTRKWKGIKGKDMKGTEKT